MVFSFSIAILVLFFSANIIFDLNISLDLQEDKLRSLIQSPNIIHNQLKAGSLPLGSNCLKGMHSTHFYPKEMFMEVCLRGAVKHLSVNNVRNTPMWMKEEWNTPLRERGLKIAEKLLFLPELACLQGTVVGTATFYDPTGKAKRIAEISTLILLSWWTNATNCLLQNFIMC